MHDDAVHGLAMTMARDVSCGKTSAGQTIAANLLRLLALPKAVQELVRNGELSAGHARALVTAVDPEALRGGSLPRDCPCARLRRWPRTTGPADAPRSLAAVGEGRRHTRRGTGPGGRARSEGQH